MIKKTTPEIAKEFQTALLRWFKINHRVFRWHNCNDQYEY